MACVVLGKAVQCAEDLGIKIVLSLKFSQQCIDEADKLNGMLGLVKKKLLAILTQFDQISFGVS